MGARPGRPARLAILSMLGVGALFCFMLALSMGSVHVPIRQIPHILFGPADGLHAMIVLDLRLPRAVAAFVVGAMLAVAGALMQVLLRNPLAEPYILGVSGGAGFGALLMMLSGVSGMFISAGAFGGALLSTSAVFGLARGRNTSWAATRLLLTGVVVAAGWGALISLLLSLAPERSVKGMLFWLMGDLSDARLPPSALFFLLILALAIMPLSRSLNLLARGKTQAATLGVDVHRLQLKLYLAGSMLTALAVTVGGSIGFVGLIVPHLVRIWFGSDHRLLLPATFVLGGSLVLLADTLARTIAAPQQLPVGILTAVIGVPVFLFLMRRQSG